MGLAFSGAEDTRGSLSHRLLPHRNLRQMKVEFLVDMLDGLEALERLKRYVGFEFGVVSLSFCFYFSVFDSVLKPRPAHLNHSLTSGLIFWDRHRSPDMGRRNIKSNLDFGRRQHANHQNTNSHLPEK